MRLIIKCHEGAKISVSLSDFKVVIVYLEYKDTKIAYNKLIEIFLRSRNNGSETERKREIQCDENVKLFYH